MTFSQFSIWFLIVWVSFAPVVEAGVIHPLGGHQIEREGVPVAQEPILDFQGRGVTVTPGSGKTIVTVGSSYFDPLEYGAVCDGATDDYAAFMNSTDGLMRAVRLAGGGAIQIPAGDCRSSGAILAGLETPIITTSTGTSGGTLTAGTYWYRVSATNALGETLASFEKSIVVAGTGNDDTATATWTAIPGATGYKVYGRTTGAEQLLSTWNGSSWSPASSGSTATSFIDYGTLTPSGAVPTSDTGGSISVIVYGQGPGVSSVTFTGNTPGFDFAFSGFKQYGAVKNLSVYTTVANANRAIKFSWPDATSLVSQANPHNFITHRKICAAENLELAPHASASSLETPVNAAFSTSTTGGTLAAGTYWYRVTATNVIGETLASTETSQTTTGTTSTVTINWNQVTGAAGYKVYGRMTGTEQLMATWNGSTWNVGSGDADTWTDTGAVTPSGALPTVDTATASWLVGLSLNDAWECEVHDMQIRGRYNEPNPGTNNWVSGSRGIELAGASIDTIIHTMQFNSWETGIWCCGLGAGDGKPGVEGLQIQNVVMNRTYQGLKVFSDVAAAADMAVPWLSVMSSHFNSQSNGITLKNRYEVILNGVLIYQATSSVASLTHFNGISFNGCLRCKVINSMVIAGGDGGATFVERFMNVAAGTAGSATANSSDVLASNNTFLDADCGSDATPFMQVDNASATNIELNNNFMFGGCTTFLGGTVTNVTFVGNQPGTTLANLPAVADGSSAICTNCGLSSTDATCATTSPVTMTVTRDGGAWKC